MLSTKILHGQSLSDLADEEKLFEAADLNGIGITDALVPGVIISVPAKVVKKTANQPLAKKITSPKVKAIAGQTWIDLTIQQLGDEERIFELCDLNSAGITDLLAAGTEIESLEPDAKRKKVVNALQSRKPSSLYYGTGNPAPEGIEYWAIELDFIVS
jgi:hypothetical protein